MKPARTAVSMVVMIAGAAAAMPAAAAGPGRVFASIDCRIDDGQAVETICKSKHLRYIDDEIAQRLTKAYERATPREKERLLTEQREFLAIRDGCGTDAGCIGDILHHRTGIIGAR